MHRVHSRSIIRGPAFGSPSRLRVNRSLGRSMVLDRLDPFSRGALVGLAMAEPVQRGDPMRET